MPSPSAAERRARDRQERRETILDAAARVFGERGPAQATMEDIAEAAEVSKGTLYLYFRNKDDLFVALTHRPLDVLLSRFAQLAADDGTSGLALLEQLIDTHSDVVRAHAAHLRLGLARLCAPGFAPDPDAPALTDYRARVQTVRGTYIAAIERGIADGTLRNDLVPARVAAAVWAAVFGANFLHMNADHFEAHLPEGKRGLEAILPTLSHLILRGLAPEEGS
ncbi:MAG: TetR/AcrR family transcriptional regulator [Sandaracinaceae bacterium]